MSIKFHLPDFARLSKFNMVFLAMYENSREFFREGVEIGSFYGVFPRQSGTADVLCSETAIKNL